MAAECNVASGWCAKRLHFLSGDAGVAHLSLLQCLRYAAKAGAGILVDGLDGSSAGVSHVSYGYFGPRWACQELTPCSSASPLPTQWLFCPNIQDAVKVAHR